MNLTVKMYNGQYNNRHVYSNSSGIQKYSYYSGQIHPRPKWVPDESFCITTVNKQFPFRILEKKNIVCGWKHSYRAPVDIAIVPMDLNIVKIYDSRSFSCDCESYKQYIKCEHIERLQNDKVYTCDSV
jgi:hypothetical protein